MAKTVRLSEETHEMLGLVRDRIGASSYEEAIRNLIARSGEFSAFGKDRDLPGWREGEDRARFRGEQGPH